MSSWDSSVLQAKRLLTGLVIGESPRWQDVRVWFANWGTEQSVALELAGNAEVARKGPAGPRAVATGCPTVRWCRMPTCATWASTFQRDRRGRPRQHLRQRPR